MKRMIKPFFFKGNKFKPSRYLITVLSHLVIVTVIMRLCGVEGIDNEIVTIMTGLTATLIGADTWRENNKDRRNNGQDHSVSG